MPMQQALIGDVFASIHEHDNARPIYQAAGQSVFAIEQETTIADQFKRLVTDMQVSWSRLKNFAPHAT